MSQLTLQLVRSVLAAADKRASERVATAGREAEVLVAAANEQATAIVAAARKEAASIRKPPRWKTLQDRRKEPRGPRPDDDDLYSARLIALPLLADGRSREQIRGELVRQLTPNRIDAALEYVIGRSSD